MDDAGDQLGTLEHGLNEHCATDLRRGGAHRLGAAHVEDDSSGLGLVRAGHRRLDDHRSAAESGGGCTASPGVAATTSGASGMPYASSSALALVGVEPGVVAVGERGRDDRTRRDAVEPAQLGNDALRPPQPRRAPSCQAQRARRRLRRSERRDVAGRVDVVGRLAREEDRRDGFARARRGDRAVDRALHLRRRRDDGPHEKHADGVEDGIGEHVREHGRKRLGGRGAEQVDRVGEARLRGQDGRERRARAVGRLGELEPLGRACVGAEDAEPSGVRDDGDARARGHGLRRQQRCRVEELRERARTQYARLAEERVDGGVRARERRGVRGGGAWRPPPSFRP